MGAKAIMTVCKNFLSIMHASKSFASYSNNIDLSQAEWNGVNYMGNTWVDTFEFAKLSCSFPYHCFMQYDSVGTFYSILKRCLVR